MNSRALIIMIIGGGSADKRAGGSPRGDRRA
jgi:hypothetical protein